jgi:hypothetical protein
MAAAAGVVVDDVAPSVAEGASDVVVDVAERDDVEQPAE